MRRFALPLCLLLPLALAKSSFADEWSKGRSLPTLTKNGAVQRMAFSPDGKRLVTVQYRNITLWDVAERKPLATIDDVGINQWYQFAGFSPDQKAWFLTRHKIERGEETEIALVDLETRKIRTTFNIRRPWGSMILSPDGQYLVYVSQNKPHYNQVVLHSVETGKQVDVLPGKYTGPIQTLTFTPDSQMLFAGHSHSFKGKDGRLTAWDMKTRKERWGVAEPVGVRSVAASSDGKVVAYVRNDGDVSNADISTGEASPSMKKPLEPTARPFLSAGGMRAARTTEVLPRLAIWWFAETPMKTITLSVDPHNVSALAATPNGKLLLVGQKDGQVLTFTPN
jgi:WD40 repeat protein